jgi:hypothetical protein
VKLEKLPHSYLHLLPPPLSLSIETDTSRASAEAASRGVAEEVKAPIGFVEVRDCQYRVEETRDLEGGERRGEETRGLEGEERKQEV